MNFNDPFGLAADVIAEDEIVLRVIEYLRENSTTFRELYDKLDATKKYTVFIDRREGHGNTHDGRTDGVSIINFDVGQINDFNAQQGRSPAWIMTAAAALAHEVGHAGGEAGFLPQHCGSDPAGGYGGCIIDFENKIRSELPQNARGGRRPHY